MTSTSVSDVSLGDIASSYMMRLTERTGGVSAPVDSSLPPEEADSVSISVEGRQKLAESLTTNTEDTSESDKTQAKEETKNEYTAELERFIKQLQKQIKQLQQQIQETQENQSLDSETKQSLLDQQYSQLATTQAMLLKAVDNLIEVKKKFKEKVELDMSADG